MPEHRHLPDAAASTVGGQSPNMLSRRDVLQLAASAVLPQAVPPSSRPRKVIVAGAGIGGLSCAWELVRRGHDVTVVEAAARTGGHVYTYRDDLDDGLYADAGAEHFTRPGYDRYWRYVEELGLTALYYPRRERILRWIRGRMYTPEMLADRQVLGQLGFNRREIDYLASNPFPELAGLYYAPYVDDFEDEYRPFDAGLNDLDRLTTTAFFTREGASPSALEFIGGSGSALQSVWHAAILRIRRVPLFPPKVYRLKGGNQVLTDTLAAKLGSRVRLDCPLTSIEHGATGVRVVCGKGGTRERLECDALVSAMSAVMLRSLAITPDWPAAKAYALHNVPYYFDSRVILQSRTRFWQQDAVSPNMEFGEAPLFHVWSTCEDVVTARGLLVGTASGAGSPEAALKVFRAHYPGKSEDIEKARVVAWAANPWASACERTDYPPGQLAKFWPTLIEPHGRIHFVGAYADNLNWGMEAATRSAHRVAEAIDGQ
jgi:monoamine oxidase